MILDIINLRVEPTMDIKGDPANNIKEVLNLLAMVIMINIITKVLTPKNMGISTIPIMSNTIKEVLGDQNMRAILILIHQEDPTIPLYKVQALGFQILKDHDLDSLIMGFSSTGTREEPEGEESSSKKEKGSNR